MRELRIGDRACYLCGEERAEALLIQPVDAHDLELLEEEAERLRECAEGRTYRIAALRIRDWNRELSPWEAPPVYGEEGFGSGAEETLEFIKSALLPTLREQMGAASDRKIPCYLGGYSLAGLFALWAGTRTDAFAGIAAASPSVWFPGWMAYAEEHPTRALYVYLSLGNREERARNPLMAQVGANIRAYAAQLERTDACRESVLEWNEGGHFKESELRCAKAFAWVLRHGGGEDAAG